MFWVSTPALLSQAHTPEALTKHVTMATHQPENLHAFKSTGVSLFLIIITIFFFFFLDKAIFFKVNLLLL